MSDKKSKELAVAHPSNEQILRRYMDSVATSALDIKRGEAVYVDKHGVPIGRKGFKRRIYGYQFGMLGAMAAGCVLMLSGSWLVGVSLYAVGASPWLSAKFRGSGDLLAIETLARKGELAEAQRRFDAIAHVKRRNPVMYSRTAGNLASHHGDHEMAIKYWREAAARSKGIVRDLLSMSVAKALALSGKVTEGRLVFEGLKFPPEADEILTGQIMAKVIFALHDKMVDVDELHDWARKALAYSHTGAELAALAWAFERVGEEDMAQLLAGEARERMYYPYLAAWWPALQQWLDGRPATATID